MDANKIECRQCQYLMFSDCYGECSKGNISGVVQPNFSCGKGVIRNDTLSVKEDIKYLCDMVSSVSGGEVKLEQEDNNG